MNTATMPGRRVAAISGCGARLSPEGGPTLRTQRLSGPAVKRGPPRSCYFEVGGPLGAEVAL